ncbi:MAG: hypothetical protein ABJN14_02455 [Paracoccaceae bacterium]
MTTTDGAGEYVPSLNHSNAMVFEVLDHTNEHMVLCSRPHLRTTIVVMTVFPLFVFAVLMFGFTYVGSDQEFLTSVAFILLILIALCTVCLGLFLHYKRYFFDIKSNQICYYKGHFFMAPKLMGIWKLSEIREVTTFHRLASFGGIMRVTYKVSTVIMKTSGVNVTIQFKQQPNDAMEFSAWIERARLSALRLSYPH